MAAVTNIVQQMTAWFLWTKKNDKISRQHFGEPILDGYFRRKKPMGKSTQPFQPKRGAFAPGAAKGIAVSVSWGFWESRKELVLWDVWCQDTLREINISQLGKRKIIFKMHFSGDMLVPWRVFATHVIIIILIVCCIIWLQLSFFNCSFHHDYC